MSKILGLVLAALLLPAAACSAASEEVEIKGTLIDNKCAAGHGEGLDSFIKTHDKECALMPDCAASGYSIYSEGKLYKFDAESGRMVKEFLDDPSTGLEVEIKARVAENGELALTMIKNRE